jgi:hypothetical protein
VTGRILSRLASALERRILGVSAAEIRYTFDDVRKELRATRAELKGELAELRRDVERLQELGEPDLGQDEQDEERGMHAFTARAP